MTIDSSKALPTAQGQRIRYLRDKVAQTTILPFAEKAQINKNTLSCWENGKFTRPIQSRNMAKLIKAYGLYGIEVTERWLRTGEGLPPKYHGQILDGNEISRLSSQETTPRKVIAIEDSSSNNSIFSPDLATSLLHEIQLFTATLSKTVVTKVNHSGFAPIFEKGDWVGGIWQDAALLLENQVCIIEFHLGQLHIAQVEKGSEEGLFNLTYFNQDISSLKPFEKTDIYLKKLAPIIRFWR